MAQRILVVDDSATELAMIVSTLRGQGFDVTTATDGDQALTLIGQSKPDLIVLDIIMPKTNGYTVCRKLKQNPQWRDIPVLMVSSKDQEADIYWGKKQGADAYLPKPFAARALLSQVRSLL